MGALARGPGVAAIRQLVRGAQSSGLTSEPSSGLPVAADQIEEALRQIGVSQARLLRTLGGPVYESEPSSPVPGEEQERRRRLFEAAADSLGRVMDTRAIVLMVRPRPGRESTLQVFGGHGVIGYRARPDAMPLVIGRSIDPPSADQDHSSISPTPAPALLSGERVLLEFCTEPLALVTSRRHSREVHAVVEPRTPGESADVVLASNAPDDDHNAMLGGGVQEMRFNVRVPARGAVFDVYLERTLAMRCVPTLDLLLWPRESGSPRANNWYDALPGGPLPRVLGPGIRHAATDLYARHAQLTEALFELSGWDPEAFVGYRCQTLYPHWAGCYAMNFDSRPALDSETDEQDPPTRTAGA